MNKIMIDGLEYDLSDPSEIAKDQLRNLQFVNEEIMQRNNELQIAETAKIGYTMALSRELNKIGDP